MAMIKLVLDTINFNEKYRVRWETQMYEGRPAWVQLYTSNNGRTWKRGSIVYMED